MAQLQWTNVGGNAALWATQSVATSGRAGIRWYEFRNLGGTPSVFQQSTYSPDSTHRWMGSLAVDNQGNMAVGYSASSSSINPQIRYAGRLATDALNTLGQGEATLIAGTGSQTSYSRWGDYASMSVDPNGCTFWYTTEYYAATGTNWQTRIGSFAFPGCSGGPTPTNTPIPPTPTNTPVGPTPTNTPVPPTPTNTPVPGGSDIIYVSSTSNGSVGGVSFADEDILAFDTGSGVWSMYLDGSDVGLGSSSAADITAFRIMDDGSILMSFVGATTIPNVGSIDDSDIVRFVPTSLGTNTAGTYEWYFDGSDVGLTTNSEDVDGLGLLPDGRILVTTTGSASVPGVSAADEDIMAFTATQLGATTSGSWALYFDGSDVGLSDSSSEDVTGGWYDAGSGNLYLTTLGAYSVAGLSGDGDDIFICTPSSLGSNTACTFSLYWNGDAHGFGSEVLDGMFIERP
jgi:hypothetical protein